MEKAHYNLDEVEAAIRKMFASLPPPENLTATLQAGMVDITVAFERFKFSQANNGLSPDAVYPALFCWMADRMFDMCRGPGPLPEDPEDMYVRQEHSLSLIADHLDSINYRLFNAEGETQGAAGVAFINPMQAGTA